MLNSEFTNLPKLMLAEQSCRTQADLCRLVISGTNFTKTRTAKIKFGPVGGCIWSHEDDRCREGGKFPQGMS